MGKLKAFLKDWRNQGSYLKWLVHYSKPFIPRILLLLLIGIGSTLLNTYTAVLNKKIIDSATSGNIVLRALILYIVIVLFMLFTDTVSAILGIILDEKFSFGIRKQIYEQIINAHWMSVKKYHTGDLMTRLTSDAGNISNGIIYTIPSIIELSVTLIITFFTLFYYEPKLAMFALLMAPIAASICFFLGRKIKRLQVKVQESESAYRSYMQESLANLLIVKSFANEDYATERLVKLREERFYWIFKRSKVSVGSSTAMSLAFQIGYIVAFSYGAIHVSNGSITYGTMTLFLTLVGRIQAPVFQLAQQVPKIVSILASAGRVMELENIPLEEKLPHTISANQIGIEVNHVGFSYEGEKEPVFTDANFVIKPGECVAMLGESGIGKTTMIRLVMSFMRDYTGEIIYTNENGEREKANASVRDFTAYVPQGNTLFSGSIKDNVIMGKIDATDEEVIEALKMAAAYDFVKDLPKGIDTVIGERGHGISEGQAQRVAIARALIRKAPFLILDEATSSLDAKTEIDVIEGIQKLTPKPTCFIITHRTSILPYCDRQIVIEDKQIINN